MEKQFARVFRLIIFAFLLLTLLQCASKTAALPNNILGLRIGMSKADANLRLREIADFERDEEKNQQLWRLKNDRNFNELAIGFDREERVRYITLFVDAATAKERIRFSDVGDLSKAKQEILPPHYHYIWEVPASDGKAAYFVNIYGDNPESVTIYSLSKILKQGEAEETEEDE